MSTSERKVVYVIGAGLSAGLGFPTINSLLPQLWDRLETAGIADQTADIVRFHYPDFNASIPDSYPTIEELLSVMKANEELFNSTRPAIGRFTNSELIKRRGALLQEIATWFHELKKQALETERPWLDALVKAMIDERATIISFNWDLVLDKLLFGKKLGKASYGLDRRTKGPHLIKPHGSLNWYRSDTAAPLKDESKFVLAGSGSNEVTCFRPTRAPRSERKYMPLIIPPVFSKQFDGPLFQRLWQETVRSLSTATEVRFLGYSLANADFHARFVLRCGFYNQEHGVLGEEGSRRSPSGRARVTVVDLSAEPLDRIKRVVGWECAFFKMDIATWVKGGGLD